MGDLPFTKGILEYNEEKIAGQKVGKSKPGIFACARSQ